MGTGGATYSDRRNSLARVFAASFHVTRYKLSEICGLTSVSSEVTCVGTFFAAPLTHCVF